MVKKQNLQTNASLFWIFVNLGKGTTTKISGPGWLWLAEINLVTPQDITS